MLSRPLRLLAAVLALPASAQPGAFDLADGDVRIAVGAKGQVDVRGVRGGVDRPPDQFLLRRLRVEAEVTIRDRLRVVIEPGFGEGDVELVGGWGEADLGRGLWVRVGRFKASFGLESLRSSSDLAFAERAFPTALSPRRDLGVMVHGAWAGGRIEAAAGVFNGVADGGSEDGERSDAKDVVARVFGYPVGGLGVGLAVAAGAERGTPGAPALADYETPADGPVLRYAEGVVADGVRQRVGPQATLAAGPLHVLAEWTAARHGVRGSTGTDVLRHCAWQLAATVRPGPTVEASARLHGFTADPATAPLAASASARRATAWALAAHWTPLPALRLGATVERTTFDPFDGGGAILAETAVIVRAGVAL